MNERLWPLILATGLAVVVVVNLSFVWFATSTQPDIEPSYTHAEHR